MGKPMDFASQAKIMTVTGKCLEALAPLSPDERSRVIFGLVLRTGGAWTFDDKQPEVALALAEQLREAADALEREAGS